MEMQKTNLKVLAKKELQSSVVLFRERVSIKPVKAMKKNSSSKESQSVVRTGKSLLAQVRDFQKQLKPDLSSLMDKKKVTKENTRTSVLSGSEVSAGKIVFTAHPTIDDEAEKSIIDLMQKASSSRKLEDIRRKRTMPSTHAYTGRQVDKTITLGKVENSVQAIRTALQKLEENGSVEDAKAICEPEILIQLLKWNCQLKVYLAPFLHGLRYTSFGRHFTQVDKLKEIVDKLQWYVQNGDTIVDFCCGANDFSQFMKETLVAAGKECSFKNYDIIHPKNDFNFERRDWMTVQRNELPIGSQLLMGLNPPFGVKGSLANKFIDKALSFKPKLLILIVPQETERLDQKNLPYDLIWEDGGSLSGKSFYLPGSVDVNDKQMEQWNNEPPPLYLWSRPDWTTKHKAISWEQGHAFEEYCQESRVRKTIYTLPTEENVGKRQQQRESREDESQFRKTMDTLLIEENVGKRQEQREAVTPKETKRNDNSNGVNSNKRSPLRSSSSSSPKKRKKMRQQEATELRIKEALESRIAVEQARNEPELSDMSISPPRARGSDREPSRSHRHWETFANSRGTTHAASEIPDMQCSGIRNSEERLSCYGNLDSFSRDPYMDVYWRSHDEDQRMQRVSIPYSSPSQEDSTRISRDDFESPTRHTPLYPSSSSYKLPSSAAEASAAQRYDPRLDDAEHLDAYEEAIKRSRNASIDNRHPDPCSRPRDSLCPPLNPPTMLLDQYSVDHDYSTDRSSHHISIDCPTRSTTPASSPDRVRVQYLDGSLFG